MLDLAVGVGIFDGEVERVLTDRFGVDGPGFGRVGKGFLELDEFFQVVVVEGIGFAEVAAGIKLVIPDFAARRAFFEEEDNGFDSGTLEDAAGIIEDGVEVAAPLVLLELVGGRGAVGGRGTRAGLPPFPSASAACCVVAVATDDLCEW